MWSPPCAARAVRPSRRARPCPSSGSTSARSATPSTPASRSWLTPVVASSGSSAATASAVRPRPSPSQHGSAIVSDRPAEGQPFYYGGQAVLEGVMMRGRDNWAVAVRRPQGEIYVEQRGLRPLGWSLAIGAAFFSLLFILVPATGTNWLSRRLPSNLAFNLVEGLVRLGFFLAYIALISQLKDIRRVFEYHGAEHKAIHCHEAKLPLTTDNVDRFPTLHVRCGTNFLLILFVVTLVLFTVGFSLAGRPPLFIRVPLQLVAVPVIVGIAYEGIRLGAGRERSALVGAIMQPGLWLQMLTTKPPSRRTCLAVGSAAVPMAQALLGGRGGSELPPHGTGNRAEITPPKGFSRAQ